jgi:uncharacterized protein (DUF433 family)
MPGLLDDYISIEPRVCNGKPVLKGTRIPLTVVLDQLASGASLQDLLRKYPELVEEQIQAVFRYCGAVIEHTDDELVPA